MKAHGIDALVVVGGDGSFTGALKLTQKGFVVRDAKRFDSLSEKFLRFHYAPEALVGIIVVQRTIFTHQRQIGRAHV